MEKQGFHLVSPYQPTGDQPEAIDKLVEGIQKGDREQTLLGVTGSGKTFTMANIIAQVEPSDAGACTQQDAGGAAVFGIPGVFSGKCSRIFCLLLRLLSAGSIYCLDRYLYRKGFRDQ